MKESSLAEDDITSEYKSNLELSIQSKTLIMVITEKKSLKCFCLSFYFIFPDSVFFFSLFSYSLVYRYFFYKYSLNHVMWSTNLDNILLIHQSVKERNELPRKQI